MAVQTATYLEAGAHMFRETSNIDWVPLERCYLIDALMLWIPKGAGEAITLAQGIAELVQSR